MRRLGTVRPSTILLISLVLLPLPALASMPKERKLLLTSRGANHPITAAISRDSHARLVAEYDAMRVVAVPETTWEHSADVLAKAGFDVSELDDTIETPRRRLSPGLEAAPPYSFLAGLFILHYVAPPKGEWQAAVQQNGAEVIQSLPGRAVLISASADQAARLSRFPWVQYVGPYLSEYKYAPLAEPWHTTFTLQMADTLLSAPAVTKIRERLGGFINESHYDSRITARITTRDLASARALLDEPFVIGVEAYSEPEESDERQAYSLSGASSLSPGASYLSWLASRGITPNALTNSGIVVDIADSGVDMGCIPHTRHPDLLGRVVYYTDPSFDNDRKDTVSHGTVVAGIVGGNAVAGVNSVGGTTTGTAQKDSDAYGQFYYGLGVAPGIRIGSTRIKGTGPTSGTIAQWTTLAVSQDCNTPTSLCPNGDTSIDPTPNCPATVQNYSLNLNDPAKAGTYTVESQEIDISVRNASRTAAMVPLAITVSAGNYKGDASDMTRTVRPWATAKNAITMGAAESLRIGSGGCATDISDGPFPEQRHRAEGYGIVAFTSRRGTTDGRLKPDLMAPATLAMGPKTKANSGSFCMVGGSLGGLPAYHGATGTSFASPVAAGAIALLRYYFNLNYGLTPSPAMYKAMLIAGAKSMTGGIDRQEAFLGGSNPTVAKWPNVQQGFGLINLSDLLTLNTVKSWRDQETVLLQGQSSDRTVTVADPSKPVRIVLAWTDAPAGANVTTTLVNNLHLKASSYDGNVTAQDGFSFVPGCGRPTCPLGGDNRNNVEVVNINPVVFANVALRTFTVRVTAVTLNGVGVPGQSGGANNQDFALFVLNGTMQ